MAVAASNTRDREPRLSLRERVYQVVAPHERGRRYPRLSVAFDLLILGCIVASCLLVLFEDSYPARAELWLRAEVAFTAIFVVEYLLRWYSAPNRLRYPFTFYALIDLAAVLPSLIALGAHMFMLRSLRGIRLLRLLRLLRLVRLLRLLRYGPVLHAWMVDLRVFYSALDYQYHLYRLRRLLVWVVGAWIIGANLVYLTEHNLVGPRGPFGDYWKSYWHVIIVLVSGIEDKEPLSWVGRAEVTLLMVAGISVVGMLTGEIVSILVKRVQRAGKVAVLPPTLAIERHVLILGCNTHLANVIRQVRLALGDQHYIVVVFPEAEEMSAGEPAIYRRVFGLSGDPIDVRVLQRAGIDRAMRVIVLASDSGDESGASGRSHEDAAGRVRRLSAEQAERRDGIALMQTLAVLSRRPDGVPIVVELQSPQSLTYAEHLERVEFVIGRKFSETLVSQAVLRPGVTEVYGELMTFDHVSPDLLTLPVPDALVGKTYREAALYCHDLEDEAVTLIGIDRSPPGLPSTRFWLNPERTLEPEQRVLAAEDRLIVVASERPSFAPPGAEELWSGKILSRS
ncbi:MAG: ion transporter [Myxococcales bacterium]|nr:ion transporter [Myxococcales bacterium]